MSDATGTLVATGATGATANDAQLLSVEEGSPMLVERRRIDDQHGAHIQSTETRYIGPRYVLDILLRIGQ